MPSYKWKCNHNEKPPVRICISENLRLLVPHSQDELELMYFFEATGSEYFISGMKIPFESDSLLIVNPHELHGCDYWGKVCRAVCVIIDLKKLNALPLLNLKFRNKISNNESVREIFNELSSLLCKSISEAELLCHVNSLIFGLLSIISREAETGYEINDREKEINEVIAFVEENLSYNITADAMAEKMHLSKDRFFHVFREFTGFSPGEYLLKCRMEKGCSLLKNTKLKISEIAQECGFCTSSYFTERFFQIYNTTPSAYRKGEAEKDALR